MARASRAPKAQVSTGVTKSRLESKGGMGKVFWLKQGQTKAVQFVAGPSAFVEYQIHNFRAEGSWQYIPCIGDGCPLCDTDDDDTSKTRYRFACNVFSVEDRKIQIMEGPKDLAMRIMQKYERKPKVFTRRVFDITKYATQPVQYEVSLAEENALPPQKLKGKGHDLEAYIQSQVENYYGTEDEQTSLDDLDEDEFELEDDEEEEDEDEDELEAEDEEDEEDEDEDDEDLDLDDEDFDFSDELDLLDEFDDDDEDEEAEEPEPPKKKSTAKKSSGKKSTSKKSSSKKKAPAKKKSTSKKKSSSKKK